MIFKIFYFCDIRDSLMVVKPHSGGIKYAGESIGLCLCWFVIPVGHFYFFAIARLTGVEPHIIM